MSLQRQWQAESSFILGLWAPANTANIRQALKRHCLLAKSQMVELHLAVVFNVLVSLS